MSRTLLAIGCNQYDHLKTLEGAENDAQQLFDALIKPEVGDYDPATSHLMLSPTQSEVRDALRDILFCGNTPETLTITFSGHGGVSAGSFYMCFQSGRSQFFG